MKKTNLILIIARKGSKDNVSRQNLRLVNEKPLIYYIMNTAKKYHSADVFVSTESEELQEIYNKIFKQTVRHMQKYETQMVASTLMAIAVRLYRTSLSDNGFSEMLQTVLDSEKDIKPYNDKETIH